MIGRALITGGAGFVGSHLAERLLQRGWRVEVIDDLSTGSIDNIADLRDNPRFSYHIDTVLNRPLMGELVDRAEVIYHLAAAVGVRLIVEQPVRTIETNIRATELVLELAAKKGKRVLVASTSEVYGKHPGAMFSEEDDVVFGPTSRSRWCYAASKMIDEFLALAYAGEERVPATVVRLFNTIGPRQSGQYGMVVPRFVRQALSNEPITVYGDGTQQRSFTWVGDVVGALEALSVHPGSVGEVYNVGHGKEVSILELARLVRRLAESESDIVFIPFEEAYAPGFEDMTRRLPDISKIRQTIGYAPTLDLPEMLDRIIAFEKQRMMPAVVA
ncbi:MAG: GDP-mannose 4,6-dehydratase [Gemmatimonadota bacterium]